MTPRAAARIRERLAGERFERGADEAAIRQAVADEIAAILRPVAIPLDIVAFPRPQVILVIGVNGSGKTTTIAKLAHLVQELDYSVMLAAGDTFRAAAIGQLAIWADRLGVELIKGPEGGDPSAVVFDAVKAATDKGIDALIVDTAGRLQNKRELMDELAKIRRVLGRLNPEAPITHHWFDSTHITYGVVTAGIATNTLQFEASAFRGREPDEFRWNIETPKFDSWSVRATWNPAPQHLPNAWPPSKPSHAPASPPSS